MISGELPQGFPQDVGGLEKLETIKRARNSKEGEVAVGLEDHNAVYATSLYSKNIEKRRYCLVLIWRKIFSRF